MYLNTLQRLPKFAARFSLLKQVIASQSCITGRIGHSHSSASMSSGDFEVTKPKPKYETTATLETMNFDNLALRVLPIDAETQNYTRQVRGANFSRVKPMPCDNPSIVAVSASAMHLLDLPDSELEREEKLAEFFSGNELIPGSDPAAHCYCGHQFGNFAGQLGDGATMYLGEVVNKSGERWEIQFKGAGKTPYSRSADGRKVLRSSIREFLCSEAIHHLGIPTTRAGTCITSDSRVIRDIHYDGHPILERCTIILRVAQSFIRFGSFEVCKPMDRTTGRQGPSFGEEWVVCRLFDYVVKTFYPEIFAQHQSDKEAQCLAFFEEVARRTARLVADWQCVGWCHGVLNTDNMSILGLTIDYGPYGFLDRYDPGFICNASDNGGRYSYANQPDVCHWNLKKLSEALNPVVDKSKTAALLPKFWEEYDSYYLNKMRKKLGLQHPLPEDQAFVKSFLDAMESTGADFTNGFRCLSQLPLPGSAGFDEKKQEVLKYLVNQSCTVEELVKGSKPTMDPRQFQMFQMLLQQRPEILDQLGVGRGAIEREVARMEQAEKLQEMSQDDKALSDEATWAAWLDKYTERLQREQGASVDSPPREEVMNSVNPKYILRNYIAQNAISAAEEGDFSEVRRVLKLLETPYSENVELTAPSSSSGGAESEESCSGGATHAERAHYDCKPPMWAMDLQVT